MNQYLLKNYPNPFNKEIKIDYKTEKNGHVRLLIINTMGQIVNILVDQHQLAGNYRITWDGTNNDGYKIPEGEYFMQMITDGFSETKKIILVK
ncbi:MAG: T9SS type A sorting domain-containing protein [Bacteroidales bacterium]|nr:T9SS type A sorting domain-containing protein [Bacteroidales bacterium]